MIFNAFKSGLVSFENTLNILYETFFRNLQSNDISFNKRVESCEFYCSHKKEAFLFRFMISLNISSSMLH